MRFLILLLLFLTMLPGLAEEKHQVARDFVAQAVTKELSESQLTQKTLDLLLAQDEQGRPLSFIPDCPICLGVQDALLAWKVSSEDVNVPDDWSAARASTRTSSLAKFVRQAVKRELGTIEDLNQRLEMNHRLRAGSEEGQRLLTLQQNRKVKAYKMMWSCLMCDAAERATKDR